MRSIDAAGRASHLEFCQEVIEIFNLQLGQGKTVFFKVGMEGGQKAFDLSEGVERSSVGLLTEIGVKRIWQIDQSSWSGQRLGDLAVAVKKTGECGKRTRGVLETAKLRELLQGVWDKHIFPNHIPAGGEAKKVDQDDGIPGDGAMGSIGL
jgi:hypothetical protein